MKTWKKIAIVIAILLTVTFVASYVFLSFRGRDIVVQKLTEFTHRKVTIGGFHVRPILSMELKNLEIEGLAKAESVSISPSIPYLIFGNIALNGIKIIKPEINVERNPRKPEDIIASQLNQPQGTPPTIDSSEKAPQTSATPQKKQPLYVICKNLVIRDGKVNFTDHTVGNDGIKIIIKDINFRLSNFYTFPHSGVTSFDLKGRIPWLKDHEEGKISLEGWLNFFKKDIQAALKIEDIDGVYLRPYYAAWVNLEKARIEKANLNFSSDIRGLNNNITAECHLELTDIVRTPLEAGAGEEKAAKITDKTLEFFRTLDKGKIVLNFNIRTKLDRPEFGFDNIKSAFETKVSGAYAGRAKVQDMLALPGKLLDGALKNARDLLDAVLDGAAAVGNKIKMSVNAAMGKK
jgi:hypothetical protein